MLKALRYLVQNPRYFSLYFLGRPARIISALTGHREARFRELRAELESDPHFGAELARRTAQHTGDTFRLLSDHYFLYALARTIRPRVILETGVFDGLFTACFLKGLEENARQDGIEGRVVSIDLPAYEPVAGSTTRYPRRTTLPTGCEPGWIIPDALRDRWTLHKGDSRELLARVAGELDTISIFFHDSLHTYDHMMFEFNEVWPRLVEGGLLLSHDVHWNHAFGDFTHQQGQVDYSAHGFGVVKKAPPGRPSQGMDSARGDASSL
jgi:predicted O-methyltransferase YrrM